MTREQLVNEYFDWMYDLVMAEQYSGGKPYRRLFRYLDDIEFTYIVHMDRNRYADGISLRYCFGYERAYDDRMIASYLDNRTCSVLEMLVALALRCEEDVMYDPDIGDQTGRWFWIMLDNLGLASMTDRKFDKDHVDGVIDTFLNRDYAPDGTGGLFIVSDRCDMRNIEIWQQMCWYLDDILDL